MNQRHCLKVQGLGLGVESSEFRGYKVKRVSSGDSSRVSGGTGLVKSDLALKASGQHGNMSARL